MTAKANAPRGDVPVTVGGKKLILRATMEAMAQMSTTLGGQSLPDLVRRVAGADPAAILAGLVSLDITGQAEELRSFSGFDLLSDGHLPSKMLAALSGGESQQKKPQPAGVPEAENP